MPILIRIRIDDSQHDVVQARAAATAHFTQAEMDYSLKIQAFLQNIAFLDPNREVNTSVNHDLKPNS